MFYAALLLKTSQIPVFFDVGLKNTVNYSIFGHLTFKNLAICSGFCLPGHNNLVKNSMFCRFCSCSCCCCCCCCCCSCSRSCSCSCCYCRTSINHVGAGGPSRSAAWILEGYITSSVSLQIAPTRRNWIMSCVLYECGSQEICIPDIASEACRNCLLSTTT